MHPRRRPATTPGAPNHDPGRRPAPPVPETTLTVDGTCVRIEGHGPQVLLMVHGWPDTAALWDPQVAHFRDRYRCARFTLPGFDVGAPRRAPDLDGMVAHLAAIVDAVSPGAPVILLLHDWGAVYGYQYALRHAARVARVVALDIGDTRSGEFLRGLPWQAKLGILFYQGWLAAAYKLPAALGDGMTRWMAGKLRAPADPSMIGASMNYPYVAQFTGGFEAALRVTPAWPLLFAYGTRKPFMFHARAWAERVAAEPGHRVLPLKAGHWVMRDQPDELHRAIDDWLGR